MLWNSHHLGGRSCQPDRSCSPWHRMTGCWLQRRSDHRCDALFITIRFHRASIALNSMPVKNLPIQRVKYQVCQIRRTEQVSGISERRASPADHSVQKSAKTAQYNARTTSPDRPGRKEATQGSHFSPGVIFALVLVM